MGKTGFTALTLLLGASISMPAIAGGWKAVPLEARNPKEALPVVVHLAQSELRIGGDPSQGPIENQYGLVGALMIGAMESGQSKKARAELEPVLATVGDFDAAAPLMTGIRSGISNLPWLALNSSAPTKDNSTEAKNAVLAQVSGNYLVDVDCSYNMGRDFEAIYSRCTIQIADKNAIVGSPDDRWKPKKLLVNRSVDVAVFLDLSMISPPMQYCFGSKRRPICREKWNQNSGALLRKELGLALEKVGALVGKQLNLDADSFDLAEQSKDKEILQFFHSGVGMEGTENIVTAGQRSLWSGVKIATLKPNSEGVLIMEESGSLYQQRTVTVQ